MFPARSGNTTSHRLTKLYRHGLIAQHATGLREHRRDDGKPPLLYSLTRRGLEVAQGRKPAPAISAKREWRAIEQRNAGRLGHDLHALAWAIELHRTVGAIATDHWRTPRYATGRYPAPQVGSGRDRHPITLNEIPVPDGQAIIDVELKNFSEVKPDVSLELRIDTMKLTFDVLVELDLTARPSYNREKFLAYDAFLMRLVSRPYPLPGAEHPADRGVRRPRLARHARVRSRAADDGARRPDRRDGHARGALVLRRTRPHPLRRGNRRPPPRTVGTRSAAATAGLREQLTGQRGIEVARVELLPEKLVKRCESRSEPRCPARCGGTVHPRVVTTVSLPSGNGRATTCASFPRLVPSAHTGARFVALGIAGSGPVLTVAREECDRRAAGAVPGSGAGGTSGAGRSPDRAALDGASDGRQAPCSTQLGHEGERHARWQRRECPSSVRDCKRLRIDRNFGSCPSMDLAIWSDSRTRGRSALRLAESQVHEPVTHRDLRNLEAMGERRSAGSGRCRTPGRQTAEA